MDKPSLAPAHDLALACARDVCSKLNLGDDPEMVAQWIEDILVESQHVGARVETTPQAVANALAEILPRRTSIFHVEIIQSTTGCVVRARVGQSPHDQREISGLGEDLATALVALHNEARP